MSFKGLIAQTYFEAERVESDDELGTYGGTGEYITVFVIGAMDNGLWLCHDADGQLLRIEVENAEDDYVMPNRKPALFARHQFTDKGFDQIRSEAHRDLVDKFQVHIIEHEGFDWFRLGVNLDVTDKINPEVLRLIADYIEDEEALDELNDVDDGDIPTQYETVIGSLEDGDTGIGGPDDDDDDNIIQQDVVRPKKKTAPKRKGIKSC